MYSVRENKCFEKSFFFIFLKQTFEMFTLKLPLNVITMN